MTDDTFIFDGGEPIDEINIGDDMADVEISGNGDDEDELFDYIEVPEDPEDDEFKLDGPDDFDAVDEAAATAGEEEDDDDDDDGKGKGYDPEYNDNVTGNKCKRVKFAFNAATTASVQRSAMRTQADNAEAFFLEEDDVLTTKPSSRVPGTFGRVNRKKGETLPAYHKRVSHELDSDDELMMEMREKGFSDRQISDKLAKDGRVRYDQKSISTRIMRIRLAQAGNVDTLLKDGMKEWEFDDDCLLMQAFALADIEVNYEVERIRAWRFRKVSEYMRRLNKEALFSANACRERYDAIVNGTAQIPTEMDDDPDTRRYELEKYRVAREEARMKEKNEKQAHEVKERMAKDKARILNAQKAEEVAHRRQQKESEKAERALKRATAAQVRLQRAGENAAAKTKRNAQIQKQKAALDKTISKAKGRGKAASTTKQAPSLNDTLTLTTSKVTTDTPDPRSYLSVQDLSKMCADRGFVTKGKDKDEMLGELRDADEEWSLADLQKMCRTKGLNVGGSKFQLRYDLAYAAAQVYKSFRAGAIAADSANEDVVMDEEE
ncbi:hypothetical protein HBI80_077810 [Parastagonospora nodorum]|nr:hypothetical protein HBI80_077810 [Parastagonospora nodorum]KAH5999543.1 hypothetical protein HBI84_101940 [Parastagonospora nodorum]